MFDAVSAKGYLLPQGRPDFPLSAQGAIHASATYLFCVGRSYRGRQLDALFLDHRAKGGETGTQGKTCGSPRGDTVCHNRNIPNGKDKIGSLTSLMQVDWKHFSFVQFCVVAVYHDYFQGIGTKASTRAHSSRILMGFDM